MKIVGISGSPRAKGNTEILAHEVFFKVNTYY